VLCNRQILLATSAISAYHLESCEFEFRSLRGVLDTTLCDKVCHSIKHNVIKFVSDLRLVGSLLYFHVNSQLQVCTVVNIQVDLEL
jgi:hypothetical protein